MDDSVPFGTRVYGILFVLLLVSRGADILSTWIATPNLELEGNPIAKRLGWKFGIPINLAICFLFASWPLPAIVISTSSILVAARNFQSAWLMRSMGEHAYRDWHIRRIQETRISLYLLCLAGNTLLTAAVGIALVFFAELEHSSIIVSGIGIGIIAYAFAVTFFTVLAIWRLRRTTDRQLRRLESGPGALPAGVRIEPE